MLMIHQSFGRVAIKINV